MKGKARLRPSRVRASVGDSSALTATRLVYSLDSVVLRLFTCCALMLTVLCGGALSVQALPLVLCAPGAGASEEDDEAAGSQHGEEAAARLAPSELKGPSARRHPPGRLAPTGFRDLARLAPRSALPLPRRVQPVLPCFQPRLQL